MADDSRFCTRCSAPVPGLTIAPAPASAPAAYAAPAAVAQPYVPAAPTETKSVISLVLGILSLFGFSIFAAIPAIILGKMARDTIRASSGRLTGEGMATAGIVMGWISVAFVGVVTLIILVIFLIAAAAGSH